MSPCCNLTAAVAIAAAADARSTAAEVVKIGKHLEMLMTTCWAAEAKDRPQFKQVAVTLEYAVEAAAKLQKKAHNKKWIRMPGRGY